MAVGILLVMACDFESAAYSRELGIERVIWYGWRERGKSYSKNKNVTALLLPSVFQGFL